MDDNDKSTYGLTPMRLELDTSEYGNGCYAEADGTVAVMVKWAPSRYANVYQYVVYAWSGTPSWYVGNVLYRVRLGDALTTEMARTASYVEFVSDDVEKYTFHGATRGRKYCVAVQAIADRPGGYLSDVYITTVTVDVDENTPKITSAKEKEDQINVSWWHYAGYGRKSYELFLWTAPQSWYVGETWYGITGDASLGAAMLQTKQTSKECTGNSAWLEPVEGVSTYYVGVVARLSNGGYSKVHVVKVTIGGTWKWVPRGEIVETLDWGTNIVEFETGVKQYQQKYTEPTRIFTATFSGLAKTWCEIREFINAHKGNLLPFYLSVDEIDRVVRYRVRLTESQYSPKFQTEVIWQRTTNGLAGRKTIGFTIELSFVEVKEETVLHTIPEWSDSTYPSEDTEDDLTHSPSLDDETTATDDTTSEGETLPPIEDTTSEAETLPPVEDTTSQGETLPPIEDTTSQGATLPPIEDTTSEAETLPPIEDTTSSGTDETNDEWGAVLYKTGDTYGHWTVVGSSTLDTDEGYEYDASDDEWGAVLYKTGDTYGHWTVTSSSDYDTVGGGYDSDPDEKEYGALLITTGGTYGQWTLSSNSDYETGGEEYEYTPDAQERGVVLTRTGGTHGEWTIVSASNYTTQPDLTYTPDNREYGVQLITPGNTNGTWSVRGGN